MITTWPRTCAGSSRLPRRIAASIPVYSAAWMPAVIRNKGPSRRPVMLKKGHEYFARPGSAVEVMYTALSRRRVTSALVEARAHSELHGLDDDLVFALNAIETRARSGVALARVPHEWEERDARPVDGQRRDHVHRHAPRVHVE